MRQQERRKEGLGFVGLGCEAACVPRAIKNSKLNKLKVN